MKKFILSLVFIAAVTFGFGQMDKPKSITLTASNYSPKVGDVVELTLTIVPLPGFHVYSEKTTCPVDYGYPPAEISLSGKGFSAVGKAAGVGYEMKKDDLAEFDKIDCQIGVFPKNGVFKQKIKITGPVSDLKLSFNGQMCDDNRCIRIIETMPPSKPILVLNAETTPEIAPQQIDTTSNIDTAAAAPAPEKQNEGGHSYKITDPSQAGNCSPLKYIGKNGLQNTDDKEKGLGLIFWLALTSGLVALITPCVFPMIPMTVSFFIKNTDRKKAIRDGLVFAVSIILIYVILGTVIAAFIGPGAANWLSTHWIPNVFFFLIFIIFAASFFGAFELVLPSSWVNAMDKRADKGGFTGPIFMAFTIALVSFSCTGPIVGTVLVESAKGGVAMPIIAMLGFSLAFALPFGLLVIFPSYLQKLPKSGGWLNSVKVVLGFIELAFALKFLSTADQTYHWRLLDREVYLSLWIVIFALLGFYLLGKLKFSHDSDLPYLSVPRLTMSIAVLAFVVYMIPGLWGAPLKFLAGYLPPMSTQDFDLNRHNNEASGKDQVSCGEAKYSQDLHIAHGIKGYFDYEQALACAKEQKKPLFIDFTGHGCVNCRKMEEKVWSDPAVLKILKNDYIVVSLYVDDKKLKLPADEQFIGKSSGQKITKLGEKNAEIQACYFNSNSQPMYVLMTGDEVLLQNPASAENFNYDPKPFAEFLKTGLVEFNKINP